MSTPLTRHGAKRALLVGNAVYDAGFDPLPSTHVDVAQLRSVLTHPSIGGYDVETALDLPVLELMMRIEQFLNAFEPGDLALLYMTGHGNRLRSTTGDFVFYARDTSAQLERRGRTAVSASFLDERLRSCQAARKVVILDACYSGGYVMGFQTQDAKGETSESALLQSQGSYVISSSSLNQVSYAGPQLQGGAYGPSVFTGHLVEALRTGHADRNGDGLISIDELFEEICDRIRHMDDSRQTPLKSAYGVTGRIDIAKRIAGPAPDLSSVALDDPQIVKSAQAEPPETCKPDWRALLEYYRLSLQRQDAFPLLTPDDHSTKYICVTGPERILAGISGKTGTLTLSEDDPCYTLLGDCSDESSTGLYYGYPVVVLRDAQVAQGQVRLAPLLIQKLELDGDQLRRVGAVGLHPTLADLLVANAELDDKWLKTYKPDWQGGNRADARRHIAWLLQEKLKLAAALDMNELDAELELGAPDTRVCNAGIYFREEAKQETDERLVQELAAIEASVDRLDDTALGALLPTSKGTAVARAPNSWQLCTPLLSNDAQLSVLRSAMSQQLTVTMGPPGTGKSQLVANVVASCVVSKQRVLLATTNNAALDIVCERLNSEVPDCIIRTGNQTARALEAKQLERLVKQAERPTQAGPTRATVLQNADVAQADLETARRSLREVAAAEQALLTAQLVAAEAEHALRDEWGVSLEPLRSQLELRTSKLWRALLRLSGRSNFLGILARIAFLLALGLWPRVTRIHDFERVARWAAAAEELKRLRRQRQAQPSDQVLLSSLTHAENDVVTTAKALLDHSVREGAKRGRDNIAALLRAQGKGDWRALGAALQHVRGWAVTSKSVKRFPHYLGQAQSKEPPFDLVIIDEASQCTIPDILPLLFRARRALVIGDPLQLGPVVGTSSSQQAKARRQAGVTAEWLDEHCLSSHAHSMFDAAERVSSQTLLLDEHYRCHPKIASFVNETFYLGKLVVLSHAKPEHTGELGAIVWRDAAGEPQRSGGSWVNQHEVQVIAEQVTRLRRERPHASLGVISPYRAQSEHIKEQLRAHPDVTIGTVHTFQGGEEDVIVLSLVLGERMPRGSKQWLASQRNLWNVAISRARSSLIVVGNRADWVKQGGIGALLADAAEHGAEADPSDTQRLLHRKLRESGYDVRLAVDLAGYTADAVVSRSGGFELGIVVDPGCGDGEPGKHLRVQLARARLMASSGTNVIRLPAWRLRDDSPLELDAELEQLQRHGTAPESARAARRDEVLTQDPATTS